MLAASKVPPARGTYNEEDDESALLPSHALLIARQTASKKAPWCINSLSDTNFHLRPGSRAGANLRRRLKEPALSYNRRGGRIRARRSGKRSEAIG
jgi:hypothetical protein